MHGRAVGGMSWTFLSYAVNRSVTFASTLVLARLLVPSDFGLLALATLAIGLFGLFRDLGLGSTLVLRQDLDRRALGTILTLMVGSSLVLAALVSAVSPLAAAVFDEPRLTQILPPLTLTLVLGAFAWFYGAMMQRELRFRRQFAFAMVQTAVYAPAAIVLAALGAGVWSLVIAQLLGGLASCVSVAWLAPYHVRPRFDRAVARDVLGSGSGFMAQGWLAFVEENVDFVVVGRALGATGLGYYSMAYRLGETPLRAIAGPIAQVTFPRFARMHAEDEPVDAPFLSVLRLVALVTCPLGVILSATADPFVRGVLGEQWVPMTGALTVLGLWAAIRPVQYTISWLLNSIGQTTLLALVALGVLVAFLPALVIAATFGGLTAIAWATAGDIVLSLALVAVFVQRRADVTVGRQWAAVRGVAIALVPCWLAARGVVELTAGSPAGVSLALASLAGAAAYLAAVFLLDRSAIPDALAQTGRRSAPVGV